MKSLISSWRNGPVFPRLQDQPQPVALQRLARPDAPLAHRDDGSRMPLFSIVTVCFNAAATLERAIESVRQQSYPAIEYIIIDGGSTDNTKQIIEHNADAITWFSSEPDDGIYNAMNKAIASTSGDIIQSLNADDRLGDEQVRHAVDALCETGADFVFGDITIHGYRGSDITLGGDPNYAQSIARTMPSLPHPTFSCWRQLYQDLGLYRTDLKVASDYDFFLRCHRAGRWGQYDSRLHAHMNAGGVSTKRQRRALSEGMIIALNHGCRPRSALAHWGPRIVTSDHPQIVRAVFVSRQKVHKLKDAVKTLGQRALRRLGRMIGPKAKASLGAARLKPSLGLTPPVFDDTLVAVAHLRFMPGGISDDGLFWLRQHALANNTRLHLAGSGDCIDQAIKSLDFASNRATSDDAQVGCEVTHAQHLHACDALALLRQGVTLLTDQPLLNTENKTVAPDLRFGSLHVYRPLPQTLRLLDSPPSPQ